MKRCLDGQRQARSAGRRSPQCEPLGRAGVSITLDAYSHAIPALQEEEAALIAGLLLAETK